MAHCSKILGYEHQSGCRLIADEKSKIVFEKSKNSKLTFGGMAKDSENNEKKYKEGLHVVLNKQPRSLNFAQDTNSRNRTKINLHSVRMD